MSHVDLYDLTKPQLARWLAEREVSTSHAARIWSYLYRELVDDVATMTDLPRAVRALLSREARLSTPVVACETAADGGDTQKLLLQLKDDRRIETVVMRPAGRATVCVSSQVGCPLGCVFCATGQMGFDRNLSAGEIVSQVVFAARAVRRTATSGGDLTSTALRNIVVMGMGEPLLNYDAVMTALEIVGDSGGLAVGFKQMTVSTVGVVPGIIRMANERRPYSLAVSMHAATQDERAMLVPAARTWTLDELMAACRYYTEKVGRRIFFEWTLIAGRNDSPEQAAALADLLEGVPAQVNLIPLNPTSGFAADPTAAAALDRFHAVLRDRGLPVSIRVRRGIDIAAGCGQLAVAERD